MIKTLLLIQLTLVDIKRDMNRVAKFSEFQTQGTHNESVINESELVTIHELPFNLVDVVDAYVGKPHTCMCGCAGKYYYSKLNKDYGSAHRGYKVEDDEINDSKIARIYNKMKSNLDRVDVKSLENYIYTMIIGKTQYTLYLKDPKEN